MRHVVRLAALCLSLVFSLQAQDAVPGEILQRTLLISTGKLYGTAFKIDHQGQVYLVTARHMVEGLPTNNATIKVWITNKWEDLQTVKTFFPPSDDVDIAVLETDDATHLPHSGL